MDSIPDGLKAMAHNQDIAERMAATLSGGEFHSAASRLAALQLVGGVGFPREIGNDERSEIHLLLVADSSYSVSQFTSRVADLASDSHRVNGVSTTRSGVVASAKGGTLSEGPLLDDRISLTIIQNFDELDSNTTSALGEVLESRQFTVNKSQIRETVNAPGSLLAIAKPKYGKWDDWGAIGEQISIRPDIADNVDALVVCRYQESPTFDVEPLAKSTAVDFLTAAESISPAPTPEAEEFALTLSQMLAGRASDEDTYFSFNSDRLNRSILRLAAASAKYRLSTSIERSDCKRVGSILESIYEGVAFFSEDSAGDLDSEVDSTGSASNQRDRIKNIKSVISDVEDEYDEGAPVEAVLERAHEVGLDRNKAEQEIEKLRRKAEVYEVTEDRLRTT